MPLPMSRIAKPRAMSPRMYWHFAVITILFTATVAVFADGERRNAIADDIAARQARAKAKEAEEVSTNRKLAIRSRDTAASFAGDPPRHFDNTIAPAGPSGRASLQPRALPAKFPKGAKQVAIPSGPYPGWMDEKADPALIELYAAQQQGRINGPEGVTAEQKSRIDEAARERAGASETAD